jgi:hypothetical protein
MQSSKINPSVETEALAKRSLNPQLVSVVKNQPGILLNMLKHALPTTKKK